VNQPPVDPARLQEQPTVFGDRILTVPNLISLARLACVPWFLWLLFAQDDRWGAALLFAVLGVSPLIGGPFDEQDAAANDGRLVLLSHGLWTQRYGADPGVVGSSIRAAT